MLCAAMHMQHLALEQRCWVEPAARPEDGPELARARLCLLPASVHDLATAGPGVPQQVDFLRRETGARFGIVPCTRCV